MNAAKLLRQKILDLAIRGKLTNREKDDEPAAALLARIAAEKQKHLAASGRARTPSAPRPITEDEKPFDLPKGWAWCRIEEIFEQVSSKSHQILESEIRNSGDYPVVSQGQKRIDGYCDDAGKAINDLPVVLFGDHTRCVKYIDFPFVIGADGTKIFKSQVDTKWLFIWVTFLSEIKMESRGYGRHWKLLTSYPVPLPPLAEQHRIVSRVEELLAEVDKYSAAMDTLASSSEMMEKKVLDLAIRGKLTKREKGDEPAAELLARIAAEKQKLVAAKKIKKEKPLPQIAEDEKPFDIPEGWAWCRLGAAGEIVLGKMLNKSKQVGMVSEYLCTINVNWGCFDLSRKKTMCFSSDELKYYELRKGDLLVCEGGDVGRCAVWQSDESYPFQNSLHRIRTIEILPEYVQMYIQWLGAIGELQRMCSGVTIKHFTNTIVSRLPVPLPPLAEQHRIVARVDELLAECRKMRGE